MLDLFFFLPYASSLVFYSTYKHGGGIEELTAKYISQVVPLPTQLVIHKVDGVIASPYSEKKKAFSMHSFCITHISSKHK